MRVISRIFSWHPCWRHFFGGGIRTTNRPSPDRTTTRMSPDRLTIGRMNPTGTMNRPGQVHTLRIPGPILTPSIMIRVSPHGTSTKKGRPLERSHVANGILALFFDLEHGPVSQGKNLRQACGVVRKG